LFSKSLVTFVGIGILAGLLFGVYLIDFKNTSQLAYFEGPGISIITEKLDFKKGEEIKIKVINTGTVPLTFSDTSYGLRITGLSGILMYAPVSAQTESDLKPNDEVEFLWDQVKNDGDDALEGLYKISARGFDPMGEKVERSTTVTIWK
jgi:hypothetical protein